MKKANRLALQITSAQTSFPLVLQAHAALGIGLCAIIMLAIYYGNGWNAQSQPFMSTRLRSIDGTAYPVSEVFSGGLLNSTAFAEYGPPKLTGTFAYSMFMANAAVGTPFHSL